MQEQQNKTSVSDIIVLLSHQLTFVCQLLYRPYLQKQLGPRDPGWNQQPGLGSVARATNAFSPLSAANKSRRDQRGTSNDNIPPSSPSPNRQLHDKTVGTQTPTIFKPNPTLPVSPVTLGKWLLHHEKPGFSFCPRCSFTPDAAHDVSGLTCPDPQ